MALIRKDINRPSFHKRGAMSLTGWQKGVQSFALGNRRLSNKISQGGWCPCPLLGKHSGCVENILCKRTWPQEWKCVQHSLLPSCAQSSAQGAHQPKSLRQTGWCIPQSNKPPTGDKLPHWQTSESREHSPGHSLGPLHSLLPN